MEELTPNWLTQLWRIMTTSPDQDEREIATILIFALAIELERIRKIRELASRLLSDYQLTSPPFSRWRFQLCRKIYSPKIGYYV